MQKIKTNSPNLSLLWPSVSLAIALVIIKATYVKLSNSWNIWDLDVSWDVYFDWIYLTWAACISQSDLLFALGAGLLGELALRFTSAYRWISKNIFYGFILFGAFCVAYAVIGRQIYAYFGAQITANLFALGAGGDVSKLQSSVLPYATPSVLVALIGAPILYLLSVWGLCRASRDWSFKRLSYIYAVGFGGTVLWFCLGFQIVGSKWFSAQDRYIVENPHWVMLKSTLPEFMGAKSSLLAIEFPPDDMLDFNGPISSKAATHSDPLVKKLRARPIKNVILIVLESVGAHYLTVYDKDSPVTPRLAAETKNAVVFDSYYTPVGWTAFALTSILHATPPPLKSYDNQPSFRLANIPTPSVATVLRERGYQTVFLASGDPQWASKGMFDNGDFQLVKTELELAPTKRNTSWGVRDKYLFDEIRQFLDGKGNDSQPFFMVAWTDQTHHPYSLGNDEKNKTKDDLQRYLSILNEVDGYIGGLLDYLKKQNLADDTLVVITGDHGEAFHQIHNTKGHGFSVYDEEVKVPLILWNPRLIPDGYRIPTVGSHVDLAPTLLDMLGEPSPAE
ncbi:MAG: sulfatase [Nitrospinae bacterium]|jgi:phosphoglycerol transferase MdoB-like AlkP superfamily enzyme|nr:sulfatase [Nitrospinota bacterium]MDA1108926.1 sulfatase [Nitrospinota bacterium]